MCDVNREVVYLSFPEKLTPVILILIIVAIIKSTSGPLNKVCEFKYSDTRFLIKISRKARFTRRKLLRTISVIFVDNFVDN